MLVWSFEFIHLRGILPDRKSHIIDLEAQITLSGGINATLVNNPVTKLYWLGLLLWGCTAALT
jgi:hypothetical protein